MWVIILEGRLFAILFYKEVYKRGADNMPRTPNKTPYGNAEEIEKAVDHFIRHLPFYMAPFSPFQTQFTELFGQDKKLQEVNYQLLEILCDKYGLAGITMYNPDNLAEVVKKYGKMLQAVENYLNAGQEENARATIYQFITSSHKPDSNPDPNQPKPKHSVMTREKLLDFVDANDKTITAAASQWNNKREEIFADLIKMEPRQVPNPKQKAKEIKQETPPQNIKEPESVPSFEQKEQLRQRQSTEISIEQLREMTKEVVIEKKHIEPILTSSELGLFAESKNESPNREYLKGVKANDVSHYGNLITDLVNSNSACFYEGDVVKEQFVALIIDKIKSDQWPGDLESFIFKDPIIFQAAIKEKLNKVIEEVVEEYNKTPKND